MKYKIPIQIAVFVLFLVLLGLILSGYRPRSETESLDAFEPDGIEMKYVAFNQNNEKSFEITCAESRKQTEDKTLMRNINAIIFKKGKMNRDIQVTGDKGFVSSNTNYIFIEDNARITSEDVKIISQNFRIKSKNLVSTNSLVHYQAEGLEGIARKGLEFFIKTNVLKLFDTEGTLHKKDRSTEYKSGELQIIDRKKLIIFDKIAEIKDDKSVLKSNQVAFQFDEDFKKVKQVKSFDRSYFFHDDREKNETMEINSEILEAYYNPIGDLKRTVARRDVSLSMSDKQNRMAITSSKVITKYELKSGQINEIKIYPPADVKNRGKSNFDISGDKIILKFKNGELFNGSARTNCLFRIDEYHGHSNRMTYRLDKNEIRLIGEESTIKKERNTFISKNFTINTREDILTSDDGIKSIINPKNRNALFSTDSIFVNAKKIEIFDQENRVSYQEKVRLQQNETILNTDQLVIKEESHLTTKGNSHLIFKDKDDEITIMGENLVFDPKEKNITIKDKGLIRSGNRMLKAKLIKIFFDDNNEVDHIQGEEEIQFTREKIQGSAKNVKWDFKKELVHFSNAAQIRSTGGGTTRGNELLLDLKTSKIIIGSDEHKRSETVID